MVPQAPQPTQVAAQPGTVPVREAQREHRRIDDRPRPGSAREIECAASSCVPSAVVKTSLLSCHRTPARSRASACRCRCSRSTSAAILGNPKERRDFFVLVSPWARTERQTSTWGGTGGSASGLPPGRRDPTAVHAPLRFGRPPGTQNNVGMQAVRPCRRIRATACPNVSDFDGRPSWPTGCIKKRGDIAAHFVVSLGVPDGPRSPACVLATVRVVRVTGSVPARATGMAPTAMPTEVDIAADLVGDTGIEPVTSSV